MIIIPENTVNYLFHDFSKTSNAINTYKLFNRFYLNRNGKFIKINCNM